MSQHENSPETDREGAVGEDVQQQRTAMQPQATEGTGADNPASSQELLRGQRTRKLTERGQELHDEQVRRLAHRFSESYGKWKAIAKDAKQSLSGQCSNDLLKDITTKVSSASRDVNIVYEELRCKAILDNETRRRVDACGATTKQLAEIVKSRLDTTMREGREDEDQDGKDSAPTFKYTGSETLSFSSHHSKLSLSNSKTTTTSRHSSLSSANRHAAAEVAANEATLKVLLEQDRQSEELLRLEAEAAHLRAKQEAENAQWRAKQEAENAERQGELEAKRRQLERLETIKNLNAAKARQQVYEQSECSDEEIRELLHPHVSLNQEVKHESNLSQHWSPPQPAIHPRQEDSMAALVRVLAESISASRLPVPEPEMFNGDPLRYSDWKLSFHTLIDRKNIPDEEKIYYLRRYVGGPAKKTIESYFLLGTELAYRSAWTLLEERYGNPFLIAKAFRDKLDAWPKISSQGSVELQELADFLRSCEAAMSQIRGLEILNDCNENQKILAKLPDWLTSMWNRKATAVEEESHTFPSFSQFVKFLTCEAKIACNPITSLHALKSSESERTTFSKNRVHGAKVLAINSDGRAVATSCAFCERADHNLQKCRQFMNETISERIKFVQENRLCFGCLRSGHRSKECESRNICETCEKGHPTCLHDNRTNEERMAARQSGVSRERKTGWSQPTAEITSREATSHRVVQNVKETHTSTIVPVWVSSSSEPQHEVLVYALLDTQSDTTFILEETAKELRTQDEPVQLKLATMASRNTVVSCRRLTGLQVRGYDTDKIILLPVTYSREFIPANRDHIPTPKTAKAWPHLKHIADKIAPQLECDIGLLIGYNCPQALVPKQVVPGEENQPFAMRTDLGWSIVGYGNPRLDYGDAVGVSHQVIVKQVTPNIQSSSSLASEVHYVCRTQIKEVILPADVLKVLESDFVERASEHGRISQEDLRFLSTMEKGIRLKDDGHYEMPLPFKKERPNLPDNKVCAIHRLRCLERKLRRNEQYKKDKGKDGGKHKKEREEGRKKKAKKERKIESSEDEATAPLEEDLSDGPSESQTDDNTVMETKSAEKTRLEDKSKQKKGKSELKLQGMKDLIHDKKSKKTEASAIPQRESSQKLKSATLHKKAKSKGQESAVAPPKVLSSSASSSSSSSSITAAGNTKAKDDEAAKEEDTTGSTNLFEKFLLNCEAKDRVPRRQAVHLPSASESSSTKSTKKLLPMKSDVFDADSESDSDKNCPTEMPVKKKKKKKIREKEEEPSSNEKRKKKKDKWKDELRPLPAPETDEEEERAPNLHPKEKKTELKKRLVVSEEEDEEHVPPPRKHKWTKERRNAKVNDIVILQEDATPRSQWKLAKVIEVYPGKDGRVRRLKLLISDSKLDEKGKRTSKLVHLERPIHKTVTLLEAR